MLCNGVDVREDFEELVKVEILNHSKDTKFLNKLESSVYQQYIDVGIEAGMYAFSIMYSILFSAGQKLPKVPSR